MSVSGSVILKVFEVKRRFDWKVNFFRLGLKNSLLFIHLLVGDYGIPKKNWTMALFLPSISGFSVDMST